MKPATTIEQQIALLKERGLNIEDEEFASKFLQRNSYYRFTGYTKLFMIQDKFIGNITFSKLYEIYCLDSEIRGLLNIYTARIEILYRAVFSNTLALEYGPCCYADSTIYYDYECYERTIKDLNEDLDKAKLRKQEEFLNHYSDLPIWCLAEIVTFGTLSKFYNNLTTQNKKKISSKFKKLHYDYLSSNLKSITNLRNLCAHRGRLATKLLSIAPKLAKSTQLILQMNNVFSQKNIRKLFYTICALIELINDYEESSEFINRLSNIFSRYYNNADFLTLYGFPKNWIYLLNEINVEINKL